MTSLSEDVDDDSTITLSITEDLTFPSTSSVYDIMKFWYTSNHDFPKTILIGF